MKIAIGCDPNAQAAKEEVIKYIESKGYGEVTDFGSEDPIYAHTAVKVAEAVAKKAQEQGLTESKETDMAKAVRDLKWYPEY